MTTLLAALLTHTYQKNWVQSQCFKDNEELMDGVKMWLRSQAADSFDAGIQTFFPQCNRCLDSGSDYIEK
jgi:hypothetical protein